MNPTLLSACALLSLAMQPARAAGMDTNQDNVARSMREPPETADRLSPERMERLVSGPMSRVERGDLPAGRAAFEQLLATVRARHGARSAQVADLLTAFGVGLYTLGDGSDDRRLKEASLPYLEGSVSAYRAAFGDGNPEVALALNSYADVLIRLNEDDPPASADAALDEAYRIRLGALGPANSETLASLRNLAQLRGLPSQTRGEPARIEAVAALFRLLIARSPDRMQPEYLSAPAARTAFARMYAENRMVSEAREQLRLAIAQTARWDAESRCIFAAVETGRLERVLNGDREGRRDPILPALDAPSRCFE